jgi:hypothetical protein
MQQHRAKFIRSREQEISRAHPMGARRDSRETAGLASFIP